MWQYLWWGLKSILTYDVPKIAVEIDGQSVAEEAAWVIVSQVSTYGGPLVFTPDAKPGRGSFEVLLQRGRGRWGVVRMFRTAFFAWLFGRRCRLSDVSFHAGKRVRLRSADGRPVPLQVDGDPGGHLPADLDLVPGAIRVATP